MKTHLIAAATVAGLLTWSPSVHAQRATERYIPVGQSPGVSGVTSYIGSVVAVDAQGRSFTVGAEAPRTIRVTVRTRIWLDRSSQRQTNDAGRLADLRPGRKVEVLFADEARTIADWIKVVVP